MSAKRGLSIVLSLWLGLLAGMAPAAVAQEEIGIAQRPVEDPLFGVRSVVPADWQDIGGGIYTRGELPEDLALVALQSSPVGIEELWVALLPQFGLEAVPETTGELSTEHLDWTFHTFETALPATVVAVELALAEAEAGSYLVLFQAAEDEFDVLREQVFVPAVEAFEALAPEPTPDPATLGYDVEEVAFPGGSEGVELAGSLTLPSAPGLHPAMVLMSGSGPQDRDSSLRPVSRLKPFALIADALTSAGIAVLCYDDRGVGGSSGTYNDATVANLTSDARAAIDLLAGREDIDPGRIGVLGHSEGAIYAATLAADDPRVSFAVVMAPPSVDGVRILMDQAEAMVRSRSEPQEEIEATIEFAQAIYPAALEGDPDVVESILRDALGAGWDRQPDDVRAVLGPRDYWVQRQVDAQLPTLMSDWFRSFLATDPAVDWERVTIPVLGLFGARDVQVPLVPNEAAWREALEAAGNEDVTSHVFPDANHLFQASETGALEEYRGLEPVFTTDFLPTLVTWVTERTGLKE